MSETFHQNKRSRAWAYRFVRTCSPSFPVAIVAMAMFTHFALRMSITFDEPLHLASSVDRFFGGSNDLSPDHPPLLRLLAGSLLELLGTDIPINLPGAKSKNMVLFSQALFESKTISWSVVVAIRLLFAAVVSIQLFCVVELLRKTYGKRAATCSGLLLLASPVLSGNAALITTDAIPSMFVLLAFVSALSEWIDYRQSYLPWIYLGLAVATKSTMLFFAPFLFVVLAYQRSKARQNLATQPRRLSLPEETFVGVGVLLALIWIPYIIISPDNQVRLALPDPGSLRSVLIDANPFLPYEFRSGLGLGLELSARPAYFNGERYFGGKWFYYSALLIIKQPSVVFLVQLVSATNAVLRRRWNQLLALLIPSFTWLVVLSGSSINIGARHLLPTLLLLSVASGLFLADFSRKHLRMTSLILGLIVFDVSSQFPNVVSHSNIALGGYEKTYAWLSDSNVDLGQDLDETVSRIKELSDDRPVFGINHGVLPGGDKYKEVGHHEAFQLICAGEHPVFIGESQFGAYLPSDLKRTDVREPDLRIGGSISVWLPSDEKVSTC